MRKLLAADQSRLLKTKIFWFTALFAFGFELYAVLQGGKVDSISNLGRDLDYYYFQPMPFFGLVISVFIAMFLGTEYSDGTMRNKLIVGHKRSDIYLSNLFTCFVGVLLVILAWLLGGLAGIPYFGLWSVGTAKFIMYALLAACSLLAITSILVLESQLISNKTVAAVVTIFTAIGVLLLASYFYNALQEPEMTFSSVTISADGIVYGDEIHNPAYIGGKLRDVYKAMLYVISSAQVMLIADKDVAYPLAMCACSLAVIVVSTLVGLVLFRKKNIK